jgi:hypothetical protein
MTTCTLQIEGRSAVAELHPGQRIETVGDDFYLVDGARRTHVALFVLRREHGPDRVETFLPLDEPLVA